MCAYIHMQPWSSIKIISVEEYSFPKLLQILPRYGIRTVPFVHVFHNIFDFRGFFKNLKFENENFLNEIFVCILRVACYFWLIMKIIFSETTI